MKNLLLIVCVAGAGVSFGQSKAGDMNGIDPAIVPVQKTITASGPKDSDKPGAPKIFNLVEQMPSPMVDMGDYLSKNIRYPEEARKKSVQGRVILQFVVNEDGHLSDVKCIRGIGAGCDEEAIRVMKSIPLWKPGKQNGKPVKVYYTQPISFQLM